MKQDDEFYIGYQKRMKPSLARSLRAKVVFLLVLAGAIVLLLVRNERPFPGAVFEFGQVQSFHGIIQEKPYPTLLVVNATSDQIQYERYYLVAEGKHGADDLTNGLSGEEVSFRGTRIHRNQQTMIEIQEGSLQVKESGNGQESRPKSLGVHTLAGEIVDSKCFFCVMNPGDSKVHRSCAIRCISGGIPPVFYIHDKQGKVAHLMLTGEDGRQLNQEVLDYVAEPLEITGEVVRYDNLFVLKSNPDTYKRL